MSDQMSKHDHVLMGLVMNLQTMALAQLGKISHPATGEVDRDLDGARGTIDLLEMLKAKCRTGTPEPLLKMLDQAVLDLQMNYVDEKKRDAMAREAAGAEGAAGAAGVAGVAGAAGAEGAEGAGGMDAMDHLADPDPAEPISEAEAAAAAAMADSGGDPDAVIDAEMGVDPDRDA